MSEDKQSIDDLIRELEARDQEIEQELESIQEEIQPTRDRRAPDRLNIASAKGQSYANTTIENKIKNTTINKLSNLITSGKEPAIECKDGEAFVMAQIMHSFAETYSLKAGLKKFKEKGRASVLKEMSQLHNRRCWIPRKLEKLTPSQIKRAMRSVIFLTEKRDGTIKTRNCIDGSSMRVWMDKDNTASPM